jgi:mannose-6-phosphate isomerase class I
LRDSKGFEDFRKFWKAQKKLCAISSASQNLFSRLKASKTLETSQKISKTKQSTDKQVTKFPAITQLAKIFHRFFPQMSSDFSFLQQVFRSPFDFLLLNLFLIFVQKLTQLIKSTSLDDVH